MSRIITLTTDFGPEDHFVGAMKGAILSVNPEAVIVDITHGIRPFDVLGGALALRSAAPFFPQGTVHVAVVDPGVGTGRRGLLIAYERHWYVGPDNGIFSLVLDGLESFACHQLTAAHYFRQPVSATFHGRDVFGPVAAWVTRGIQPAHFGPRIGDPVRLRLPRASVNPGTIEGEVIHVDRFGNLVTSVTASDLETAALGPGAVCLVGNDPPAVPLCSFYGEAAAGEPCALVGSSGFLEVAVNLGSAADRFGASPGTRVTLRGVPASPP